ncbi:MAG: efflux RND transporter permease subunit [Bacteroidales bacterium]|nr:efflux RND transporter permease subunit [Bacteroidales bacterium]
MKLDNFIKRPVLSGVISVMIVLVGVLGLTSLPIEQYPDIAPPTVGVSTSFYGADAQTIMKSVITPLEEAINGVESMMYMKSTATNTGTVDIDIVFKQGTNPDMAAVNVQNRVQKALALLPAEVKQVGVSVQKQQNSILQIFSIWSPDDTYDFTFLSNYASINIKPQIMLINGIGKFQSLGSDYSMRIWLDPMAMAQHNLIPSDIMGVLSTQNIEAATGTFGQDSDETYQYTMKYTGRLKSIEEFEDIIIRTDMQGNILRLRDVARVELGMESNIFTGQVNGHPGVTCIAYQTAGSNATKINKEIEKVLKSAQEQAPSGIEIISLMNTNDFLYASIEQVVSTLRDAILLVILIVLLFLKDIRSTLIPFISILVSLIGTFAFMMIAGFSINLLTLFALVLVIGTVVDDSIVVVEAVHSKFDSGITSSFKATKEAVKEISLAVITSSLVFMAVFIPVSFMGGTSGVFYRQFGLTMAVAVGISALNALTTVPALCAMILKPIKKPVPGEKLTFQQKYALWFDGFFDKFSGNYSNTLRKTITKTGFYWLLVVGGAFLLVFCMIKMPGGLVPGEDKGSLIVEVNTLPGTSLSATNNVAKEISKELLDINGISDLSTIAGYGFIAGMNSSAAAIIIKLDNWSERGKDERIGVIAQKIQEITSKYEETNCLVFSLPMIPGYGSNDGIDMYIQDRRGGTVEELYEVTKDYIAAMNEAGLPAFTSFNMDYPQWEVSVDVAKCMRAGLSPQEVLGTLGTYYGGSYASDMNLFAKVYKVMVQGESDSRRDENSLFTTFVRTASGEMAPLSNFVSIRRVYGPDGLVSFNKFTAINVSVNSDRSMGETISMLKETAKENLPEGYTIDFAGMAREQESQGGLGLILLLCVFIIYLILAALYESVVIPLAVLLSVPLGLAGSYAISMLVGLDNNIYLQTGVIMLIGLLAKTAILITEYASERRKNGLDIKDAAIEAAGARLRPIMMTAGTMVIGLLPLITSINGVGGMGNFSLGVGTIVGMIIGTIGLLFITPVMFTVFQKIQEKIVDPNKYKEEDIDEQ